jgi:hypothetical protein
LSRSGLGHCVCTEMREAPPLRVWHAKFSQHGARERIHIRSQHPAAIFASPDLRGLPSLRPVQLLHHCCYKQARRYTSEGAAWLFQKRERRALCVFSPLRELLPRLRDARARPSPLPPTAATLPRAPACSSAAGGAYGLLYCLHACSAGMRLPSELHASPLELFQPSFLTDRRT